MTKLLPIGSVVLLKEGKKRVMIYGRKQVQEGSDKIWDYIACLYPEGNISPEYSYVFDHDRIQTVFFIGFQDIEEIAFGKYLEEQSVSIKKVQEENISTEYSSEVEEYYTELIKGLEAQPEIKNKPNDSVDEDESKKVFDEFIASIEGGNGREN